MQKGYFLYEGLFGKFYQPHDKFEYSDYCNLEKFILQNKNATMSSNAAYNYKKDNKGRQHTIQRLCLKKYLINKKLKRGALRWLHGIGITEASLFLSSEAVVKDTISYTAERSDFGRQDLLFEGMDSFGKLKCMTPSCIISKQTLSRNE